jgi:hypothetical protein
VIGNEPLRAVISYSSGDRKVVNYGSPEERCFEQIRAGGPTDRAKNSRALNVVDASFPTDPAVLPLPFSGSAVVALLLRGTW